MFFIKMTQARKAIYISESVNTVVKEQRVDGSFTSLNSIGLVLRCTLLGFKKNS